MVKENVLYRLRQAKPFDVFTAAELVDFVFVTEPDEEPSDPQFPHAEWYCSNPPCAVREVSIRMKHIDGRIPKRRLVMKCPRCGRSMKFHNYLRSFTLAPHGQINEPEQIDNEDSE
jgi:hypothetical protein